MSGNAKFRWFLLSPIVSALLFIVSSPVVSWASETGYVDIQAAVTGTNEWKRAFASFKTKFQIEKSKIAKIENRLKRLINNFNLESMTLSPYEKKEKEETLLKEKKDFEQYVQDKNAKFAKEEKEITGKILKKMVNVIKHISKEHRVAIVEKKTVISTGDMNDFTRLATRTYNSMETDFLDLTPVLPEKNVQEFDRRESEFAEKSMQLEEERKKLEEERKKFEALRLADENRQRQAQAKKKPSPQSGSGSGFFVSKMGHVITNAHVVQNCKKITIGDNANKQVSAELINTDRSNDLALLKLSTLEMASAESKSLIQKLSIVVVPLASKGLLRSDDVKLGEKVLVAGYPFGELFSNTIKVTTGVVSATRGAGDDSGQFQLDAAVQPGNSGGPIYDSSGNIVGVVISQLDKLKMAKAIGTLPELVNFGIKASTVRQFLTSSGLPSKKSERTEEKSTEQLAEIAKNQALMVMCLQ
jgi:S1-C subfamily serine protease